MGRLQGMKFTEKPEDGKEKELAFDWRKEGYRVLVAPKTNYSVSVTYYRREPSSDGMGVSRPLSKPLTLRVLSGGERDLLGYGDLVLEEIPDPAEVRVGVRNASTGRELQELPGTTEKSATVRPPLQRRIPLYGCQLRIDKELAEEFEDVFGGFEQLIARIESGKRPFTLYGKHYAFIDDKEGMRRLLPRFADFARTLEWDKEEVNSALIAGDAAKVGPPLWAFEPERFERRKDGRYW